MNLFMLIIKALSYIATVVTAFLVYLAWKQIKLLKEQATTSFENGLTQHYRQIMESIPTNIWLGSALETLDEGRQNRCRDAIYGTSTFAKMRWFYTPTRGLTTRPGSSGRPESKPTSRCFQPSNRFGEPLKKNARRASGN